MPLVDVRGERLYYEIAGRGPPLVLIRGLSRSMRFWEPLVPHISGRFTVLSYDHRGIGRSPIHGRKFSLADLADDCAALMRATGFDRAAVLGLSMGGMVAQHLAINHPELVERLVLGGTWAGGTLRGFPRVDTFTKLALYGALPPGLAMRRMGPLLMSPAAHRARPDIADGWTAHLLADPVDPAVIVQQALAAMRHDTRARLSEIVCPTLVVTGDADRLVPARNSRTLVAKIPNARLEVLRGVGHELTSESPAEVGRLLREFALP